MHLEIWILLDNLNIQKDPFGYNLVNWLIYPDIHCISHNLSDSIPFSQRAQNVNILNPSFCWTNTRHPTRHTLTRPAKHQSSDPRQPWDPPLPSEPHRPTDLHQPWGPHSATTATTSRATFISTVSLSHFHNHSLVRQTITSINKQLDTNIKICSSLPRVSFFAFHGTYARGCEKWVKTWMQV